MILKRKILICNPTPWQIAVIFFYLGQWAYFWVITLIEKVT